MNQHPGKLIKIIRDSRGFSLLEAMISLAIFSVGILGIAALQSTATTNNAMAETSQGNTAVAMSEIEELMAADYIDQRIFYDGAGAFETADGKYSIAWNVVTNKAVPGAKVVEVTAQYIYQGRGRPTTFTIIKPRIN